MTKFKQIPQSDVERMSKFASILAGIIVTVLTLAGIAVALAIPVIIWAWILTL